MKIEGKVIYKHHILKTAIVCSDDFPECTTRTKKIFRGLEEICYEFDLGVPIWLDSNINEFKRMSRTRFFQDNFMEKIRFDYLELNVLEE